MYFVALLAALTMATPAMATAPGNIQELMQISTSVPNPPNPKCDSDDDCPGFANYCFAGECNQQGYLCDSDDDCPGFNNYCFAGECNVQEPLCDSDDDCPGFANYCFAGKCANP